VADILAKNGYVSNHVHTHRWSAARLSTSA
jgi:hypothetical protein